MRTLIEKIKKSVSGEQALAEVREIANYHRIQASPGFREAAVHIRDKLVARGFDCRMHSYPSTPDTWYYSSKMFKEWHCISAVLKLQATGETLADYQSNPISIIQRSYGCDFRNDPLEIVLLDKGNKKEAYEGLDISGKMIFVREPFKDFVPWAIKEKGALGIITDCIYGIPGVRIQADLYDTLNYTSFWLKHTDDEPKAFGFVLTPRKGDVLAKLCQQYQENHKANAAEPAYPKITCHVDSEFYDGAIEVVDTLLHGESEEEIWLVAHLCHPRMSANDNASGVAAGMTALYTLKNLIESKEIPPLKRSIRVLFMPEFSGTYAYLKETWKENRNVLAAINLDMVGGRQGTGYGPLTISGLPDTSCSFITDVARLVMDEVKACGVAHSNEDKVALVNTAESGFDAGSDNYILSDPSIDIPTLMLGQWPDLNYHTSSDTPEIIDPVVLHVSTSFGAAFTYFLANLSLKDAELILNKSRETFSGYLARFQREDILNGTFQLQERSAYMLDIHRKRNQALLQFSPIDDRWAIQDMIARENALAEQTAEFYRGVSSKPERGDEEEDKQSPEFNYIPVRKYVTPILRMDDFIGPGKPAYDKYQEYLKSRRPTEGAHRFEALVQFHINGKDNLLEIVRKLKMQVSTAKPEIVNDYVQILRLMGLVEIKEES